MLTATPWSKESMAAALQDDKGGMSVYNLPLRRRVTKKVDLECKSGPQEESELASYCVKMVDMGFGLSRADIMVKIIE